MRAFPAIPDATDAPEKLFEQGHLWLLEYIDGAPFRFQLQRSGVLRFGDEHRVYNDPDTMPEPYNHAVRHVQTRFDRQALQRAVDDVEDVVFFAYATQRQYIDYDWERMPPVLGRDVWSETEETLRPPDAVDGIFEQLGLRAVNVFEREVRARDFDPQSYSIPSSEWYDGPAAGVVIWNKKGERAKLRHSDLGEPPERKPADPTAEALARRYVTRRTLEALVDELERREQAVTFTYLYERALEESARKAHDVVSNGDIERDEYRSEVATLVRKFLDEYEYTRA